MPIKYILNPLTGEFDAVQGTDPLDAGAIKLNTSHTPLPSVAGLIQWNAVDGTYDMGLLNSSVLQVGQELMFYGKASGAISNGDVCQFAGVQGDHILIKKAVGSEVDANQHFLVGVATESIANGAFGYVTWFGKINGVYTKTPANNDTVDWVAGDILYFNITTGQLTKTMPSVPNRVITVAAVIKTQTGSAENGIIIVRPTFGQKLQDLDDVNGSPLTRNGQIPIWNNTGKYFDFEGDVDLGTSGITAADAKFGSATNYIEFEADGTLLQKGAATTYDDLLGDVTRIQVSGVGIVQDNTENALKFQTSANLSDYALGNYQLRHRWKAGSSIFPHIHFEQAENNIPNFLIRYRWQRNLGAKTTTWSDYKCNTLVTPYTSGTVNNIAYGAAITAPTGYSISDIIEFRIFRDNANTSTVFTGADPYTADVLVTGIDIHIEEDSLGSHTEYAK